MAEKLFGGNLLIKAADPDAIHLRIAAPDGEFEEVRKRCYLERNYRRMVGLPVSEFPNLRLADMPFHTVEEMPDAFDVAGGQALGAFYFIGNLVRFSAKHERQYHVLRYEYVHFFYAFAFGEPLFAAGTERANVSHGNEFDPWIKTVRNMIDVFWEGLEGHPYRPRLVFGTAPAGAGLVQTDLGPAHVLGLDDHH